MLALTETFLTFSMSREGRVFRMTEGANLLPWRDRCGPWHARVLPVEDEPPFEVGDTVTLVAVFDPSGNRAQGRYVEAVGKVVDIRVAEPGAFRLRVACTDLPPSDLPLDREAVP